MGGIEASRILKEQMGSRVKVVILTMFHSEPHGFDAVRNGCDGYLFKGEDSQSMVVYIRAANRGTKIFGEEIGMETIEVAGKDKENEKIRIQLETLNESQKSMVRLVTAGRSDKQIAEELNFSEGHIRNTLCDIRRALDLPNRSALAVWGARAGL
jgi:Response regulator containing a CheY-like receiver domain and an HTH DNA-binding domain